MRVKILVLLLLGVGCLGAEGAIGRRRTTVCPTVVPIATFEPFEDVQPKAKSKDDSAGDEAAVRKSTAEFAKVANARNAKAAAALWTEAGEFTDDTGSAVRGRANLEKMYTESFAATPKGKFEIVVDSVRSLGKNLATSEGTFRFTPADGGPDEITKFSSMHVREGTGWLVASAKEWSPDDADLNKISDLEFLIGEWEAKRDGRELKVAYAWGDGKAFIQVRFTVKEKDVVKTSGTEIIAKDPGTGELRGWIFDKSGSIGESVWMKDGKKWVIEAGGTLPLGVEMSATNILIPLGKDAFTWQSVDRFAGGQSLPNEAPLKVTRVKK